MFPKSYRGAAATAALEECDHPAYLFHIAGQGIPGAGG
jgi:hypothetical protein